MDPEVFWEKLGLRNPNLPATTLALACFAQEYVEHDSKKITDYSPFMDNFGHSTLN